jgi:hypothetical protein
MSDNSNPILIEELIGKHILIGITRIDHLGNEIDQIQCHGYFESIDDVIHIRLKDTNEDFTLPPDLSVFQKAQPGEYRLRSTGEVVINPDYLCIWSVHAPSPDKQGNTK